MYDGTPLTEKEVIALLQRRILVSYSKNEDEPVRITIYSETPAEAIAIANAIAASLQSQLARLEGPMDNEQDVQIQNAIMAQRTSSWFMILVKTPIIVVPLSRNDSVEP
jgi:capsular polysaccharide biosynthesis protein